MCALITIHRIPNCRRNDGVRRGRQRRERERQHTHDGAGGAGRLRRERRARGAGAGADVPHPAGWRPRIAGGGAALRQRQTVPQGGGNSIEWGRFLGLILGQFWGCFFGRYLIKDIKWPKNWPETSDIGSLYV